MIRWCGRVFDRSGHLQRIFAVLQEPDAVLHDVWTDLSPRQQSGQSNQIVSRHLERKHPADPSQTIRLLVRVLHLLSLPVVGRVPKRIRYAPTGAKGFSEPARVT